MSAPPVVDARGVADLRLWLTDQWRPGRIFHRMAAPNLSNKGWVPGEMRQGPRPWSEWELRTLESATLWWVGADMVDLLMAAAAGVPDDVVQYDLPVPAGAGLVVFEKPWWGVDADPNAALRLAEGRTGEPEGRIAVDAVAWGGSRWRPREVRGAVDKASYPPGTPGTPWWTGYTFSSYRRLRFEDGMTPSELELAAGTGAVSLGKLDGLAGERTEHGTLVRGGGAAAALRGEVWAPMGHSDWPVLHRLGDQPWQGTDLPAPALASYVEDRKVMAAFWTLIEQEGIASRREERPARPVARRTERAGIDPKLAAVQVVTLRRARRTDAEPADDHAKVNWSHRWLVAGHWRWARVGKGRTLRRLVYVRPHVKGPEDMPLHVPTKVHAWTR